MKFTKSSQASAFMTYAAGINIGFPIRSVTASLMLLAGGALAHNFQSAGLPVCLEGNYMVADSMNGGGANGTSPVGPGRVLEMNTTTGETGVAFNRPATGDDPEFPTNSDCPACSPQQLGAWKPTGVLSGGINGHAFVSSAAWGVLSEFHRNGIWARSKRMPNAPAFELGPGAVPRLLGSQFMPNGNIIQTSCDANFPGSPNANRNSENYFPPLWSTPERANNSRLIVLDPKTLNVIDEYSIPQENELGHELWTCPAGVYFAEDGMYVSGFHSAAAFVIDWEKGADNAGSPNQYDRHGDFKFGRKGNAASVKRIIDMYPDSPPNDPRRRDSLRAMTFDSDGGLYGTNRARAFEPSGDGTPEGTFRHHVFYVPWGEYSPKGTTALDPAIQVIAGVRVNRMSGKACEAINPNRLDPDACNVETLYVAATGTGEVWEYLIGEENLDDPDNCSGDPADGPAGSPGGNSGCALPIAKFHNQLSAAGESQEAIDPRMLMIIHEAFGQ